MSRLGKIEKKFDFRITGSNDANARRMAGAFKKRENEAAKCLIGIQRELKALDAEYKKSFSKLLGRGNAQSLNEIRNNGTKFRRSQKGRHALSVLEKSGVDSGQILDLQLPYLTKTRDIIARHSPVPPIIFPFDGCDGAFASYAPPYSGWFWSYFWERESRPKDPVIGRYLDAATGRVGSKIRTPFVVADDYDYMYVEYNTGFNIWHTPQTDGPLEIKLTFAFPDAVFEGEVYDKMWAFSDILHDQLVGARIRVTDSQDPNQYDEAFRPIDRLLHSTIYGEDHTWSHPVVSPFEDRTYKFKTAATFYQGSPVLLETGVKQVTMFIANDEGISTNANIDLLLSRVEVRSCEPDILTLG